MIRSTLQQSLPTKAPETFPALYQHNDGGVWLFTSSSSAVCVKCSTMDGTHDRLGKQGNFNLGGFTRLAPDQQVVLQNSD